MDLSLIDITFPDLGKKYIGHYVFDQLDDFISFYDTLSYTTMVL